jgi:hypothetical protein
MSQLATAILALFVCASTNADPNHPRPRILGIFSVRFYSANLPAARQFYAEILDEPGIVCHWCEAVPLDPLTISLPSRQLLICTPPNGAPPSNLLTQIFFVTDDGKAMRQCFAASIPGFEQRICKRPEDILGIKSKSSES